MDELKLGISQANAQLPFFIYDGITNYMQNNYNAKKFGVFNFSTTYSYITDNLGNQIRIPDHFCGPNMNTEYLLNSMRKKFTATIFRFYALDNIHSVLTYDIISKPNASEYFVEIDALCVNHVKKYSGAGYILNCLLDACNSIPEITSVNLSAINVPHTIAFYTKYGFVKSSKQSYNGVGLIDKIATRPYQVRPPPPPTPNISDAQWDELSQLLNNIGVFEPTDPPNLPTNERIPTTEQIEFAVEVLRDVSPDNVRKYMMPKKFDDYYVGEEYDNVFNQEIGPDTNQPVYISESEWEEKPKRSTIKTNRLKNKTRQRINSGMINRRIRRQSDFKTRHVGGKRKRHTRQTNYKRKKNKTKSKSKSKNKRRH